MPAPKICTLFTAAALLAGCGSSEPNVGIDPGAPPTTNASIELEAPERTTEPATQTTEPPAMKAPSVAWYDPEAEAECDTDNVGEDKGPVRVIYRVDEGELGEVCLGEDVPELREAWEALAELTTPEARLGVRLYAGWEGNEDNDLLAFATPTFEAEGGELSIIAVEIDQTRDDPAEARLTILHELAHVFTQTPDQLEWHLDPDECGDTYWNDSGCTLPDSYLNRWVEDFWTDDQVAAATEAEDRDSVGAELCEIDSNFLGEYAATHPDEDFAESFSAYVYDLRVAPAVQDKIDWFGQFPEFAEMRAAAANSDQEPPPNSFTPCG